MHIYFIVDGPPLTTVVKEHVDQGVVAKPRFVVSY